MRPFWLIVGLIVLLTGCAGLEESGFLTPQPATSKYLRTTGAGFGVNTGKPGFETKYLLNLDVLDTLKNGAFLEVQFENPQDPKKPLISNYEISPGQMDLTIESGEIDGLESYQGYVVMINIYDNRDKKNLLGTHRQVIQSIVDEKEVEAMVERKKKENSQ